MKGFVTVLELTKFIGLLASTIQVVLLAQLLISSAATDKCSKTQWVIIRGPVLEQGVKERTTVVDSKFETLQWSIDNTTSVLCYNKNRCLQEGVGCTFSRDTNRRGVDIRGKGNAHKYFGTVYLPNKRNFRDRPVASRLSHQLPKYFAWRPDPYSQGIDAMQHPWGSKYLYALPLFSMINKVLNKVKQDKVGKMLLVAPTWQSQTLYSILLSMSLEKPILLPQYQHPLRNSQKTLPPLLINKTLMINGISAYAQY